MVDGKVGQDSARPLRRDKEILREQGLLSTDLLQYYQSVATVTVDARGLEDLGLNQLTPQSL